MERMAPSGMAGMAGMDALVEPGKVSVIEFLRVFGFHPERGMDGTVSAIP